MPVGDSVNRFSYAEAPHWEDQSPQAPSRSARHGGASSQAGYWRAGCAVRVLVRGLRTRTRCGGRDRSQAREGRQVRSDESRILPRPLRCPQAAPEAAPQEAPPHVWMRPLHACPDKPLPQGPALLHLRAPLPRARGYGLRAQGRERLLRRCLLRLLVLQGRVFLIFRTTWSWEPLPLPPYSRFANIY